MKSTFAASLIALAGLGLNAQAETVQQYDYLDLPVESAVLIPTALQIGKNAGQAQSQVTIDENVEDYTGLSVEYTTGETPEIDEGIQYIY
jgi:hypothetical protein